MRVLIACECSGRVRDAFRALGNDAWSCDLLPDENDSPFHYQRDAIELAYDYEWDLMIAHPPCTRIANSGVRWLQERNLWDDLDAACKFFRKLMDAPIDKIAIENPIPHTYAVERIGRSYDQIIHPWQHGHGESKATCLWLKKLAPLKPSNIVTGRDQRIWKLPPGPDRQRERSRTYQGIANAMADQWGQL